MPFTTLILASYLNPDRLFILSAILLSTHQPSHSTAESGMQHASDRPKRYLARAGELSMTLRKPPLCTRNDPIITNPRSGRLFVIIVFVNDYSLSESCALASSFVGDLAYLNIRDCQLPQIPTHVTSDQVCVTFFSSMVYFSFVEMP